MPFLGKPEALGDPRHSLHQKERETNIMSDTELVEKCRIISNFFKFKFTSSDVLTHVTFQFRESERQILPRTDHGCRNDSLTSHVPVGIPQMDGRRAGSAPQANCSRSRHPLSTRPSVVEACLCPQSRATRLPFISILRHLHH